MKTDAAKLKIPNHIGFIMDGNGRWATKRLLPRMAGHKEGSEALRKILIACKKYGIKVVSVFAFSTENWNRPEEEVNGIFELIKKLVTNDLNDFIKDDIKICHMGTFENVPKDVVSAIKIALEKTKNCRSMFLNIGFNYGGRQEILYAVNNLLEKNKKHITEKDFTKELFTHFADPDIIVRTSGEQRISNFMLWQMAYSEFIFIDTLWPDMREKDLIKILEIYTKRNRRFGKIENKEEK